MAEQRRTEPPVEVVLSLPEGWIGLPRAGTRGGLLRRDPYEQLARQLVSSGAVAPTLLRSTRNYLERVAPREEHQIAGAALVRASGPDDAVLATYAVFVNLRSPSMPQGIDRLKEWVSRPGRDDSGPREVSTVELGLGPAVRGQWRQGGGGDEQEVVQHWVELEDAQSVLLLTGTSDSKAWFGRLAEDYDAIAAGTRLAERT